MVCRYPLVLPENVKIGIAKKLPAHARHVFAMVQIWVGQRQSSGSLNDLRELVSSAGHTWGVEDHGYNMGD